MGFFLFPSFIICFLSFYQQVNRFFFFFGHLSFQFLVFAFGTIFIDFYCFSLSFLLSSLGNLMTIYHTRINKHLPQIVIFVTLRRTSWPQTRATQLLVVYPREASEVQLFVRAYLLLNSREKAFSGLSIPYLHDRCHRDYSFFERNIFHCCYV